MTESVSTGLLKRVASGDDLAAGDLFPLIYGELRRIAEGLIRRQPPGYTLQPTALVHEAYIRMVDQTAVGVNDRNHFIGIAAGAMRRVIVDHTRRRLTEKRGGKADRVPLTEVIAVTQFRGVDLLALEEALTRLEDLDARKAKIVELRYYLGMTVAEAAAVLGVSPKTVEKDWRGARAWLRDQLQ